MSPEASQAATSKQARLERECLPGWMANSRDPARMRTLLRALLHLAQEFGLGLGLEEGQQQDEASSFYSAASTAGARQAAWEAFQASLQARACLQRCYALKYHWPADAWYRSRLRNWVAELEGIAGALESAVGLNILESAAQQAGLPSSAQSQTEGENDAKQLPTRPAELLKKLDLRQLLPHAIAISETSAALRQLSMAASIQTTRIIDAGYTGFPETGIVEDFGESFQNITTRVFGSTRPAVDRCSVM